MSIDDQRDLHERLDRAVEAISPPAAPVDGVMRRGKAIRWRRRSVTVAGVAAVVAAGLVVVPSPRHIAAPHPVTGHYTATVRPPGPHSLAGVIAAGTVNGRRWQLTVGQTGTDGAGRGQQMVIATGPFFGPSGMTNASPAFTAPRTDPVLFLGFSSGSAQAEYGAVAAGVSYVKVRLGNGIVLTLHPVRVYGVRLIGFAIPAGAPVVSATAYSARGVIATATAFNGIGKLSAGFTTWLKPGQQGLARASGRVGSGSYQGKAWSARAYLGPWGICLTGQAGGTDASSCLEAATTAGLGTGVVFWTPGVPAVAYGTAGPSVARIVVTSPAGKTTRVRPVTVGGARLFAFPFGRGPKPWKWTAYDGSGHAITSGRVTPGSQP